MKASDPKTLSKFLKKDIPEYGTTAWLQWHLQALVIVGVIDSPSYGSHIAWLFTSTMVG